MFHTVSYIAWLLEVWEFFPTCKCLMVTEILNVNIVQYHKSNNGQPSKNSQK